VSDEAARRLDRALNRLAKWRAVYAGWQLGTRPKGDGEAQAVRDHREVTLMLRAEVTTLTGLLVRKGVLTEEELQVALAEEADQLSKDLEGKFPGMQATDDGIVLDPEIARTTMAEKGFPT